MRHAADIADEVPVLVVGGGGAGLTASMLLARQAVEHLLVSARPGTSDLPKAHVLNQRTMEVLDDVGVAARSRVAARRPGRWRRRRSTRVLPGRPRTTGGVLPAWSAGALAGQMRAGGRRAHGGSGTCPRSVSSRC